MRRPDPVILLTLLGLVGSGALAALHPTEAFDPTHAAAQAGRHVTVDLEVTQVSHAATHSRGKAAAGGTPIVVEWVWFRPPEAPPHPGDRIVGRALVERDPRTTGLILDGKDAHVIPGPMPVAVRWVDLVAHPERFRDRLLAMHAAVAVDGPFLLDPAGRHRCPLTAGEHTVGSTEVMPFVVSLVRIPDAPGWACRIEGGAQ